MSQTPVSAICAATRPERGETCQGETDSLVRPRWNGARDGGEPVGTRPPHAFRRALHAVQHRAGVESLAFGERALDIIEHRPFTVLQEWFSDDPEKGQLVRLGVTPMQFSHVPCSRQSSLRRRKALRILNPGERPCLAPARATSCLNRVATARAALPTCREFLGSACPILSGAAETASARRQSSATTAPGFWTPVYLLERKT